MKQLQMDELNRLSSVEALQAKRVPVILVLDNVRSMHNIGACFRTADAFRIEAIYLCGITAKPPHREIEKTALGATESVPWQYYNTTNEAINALRNKQFNIIGIEQTNESITLNEFSNESDKIAIIMGHEVYGINEQVLLACDKVIEIPQFGAKHSLNVSVAAGIVLYNIALPQILKEL